ncbi:Crinkler (CRN) [Phytophthora megakarya]|uniref:Crinkler (CRN) n=1 Tax=Phytophthora megakarya TaxID=4795 RepID=A0A225W1D1_9STRA|nr:Crinkler (CRN) [Phytophthora megakarya]
MVKLHCAIVGIAGITFPVDIDENKTVGDLKDAIKNQSDGIITCDARELQLFLAKKGVGWLTENDVKKGINDTSGLELLEFANVPLNLDGLSEEEVRIQLTKDDFKAGKGPVHVLVVVPKPKRPAEDEGAGDALKRSKTEEQNEEARKSRVLDDFKILSASTHEFQLDSLFTTQQSNSPIVRTPDLHEFWKGFGEFPPYYFVRMEECVFWKVIKPLLFGKNRIVIVGSPGVGKSCFLMLIAFYLACIKKKKMRRTHWCFSTALDRTHD